MSLRICFGRMFFCSQFALFVCNRAHVHVVVAVGWEIIVMFDIDLVVFCCGRNCFLKVVLHCGVNHVVVNLLL